MIQSALNLKPIFLLITGLFLFSLFSPLIAKTANAQLPDCAYDFPGTIAAGSTLNIDVGGTTVAGHTIQGAVLQGTTAIASARAQMPSNLSLNLALNIPANTSPGNYVVLVVSLNTTPNDESDDINCVVRAPSPDTNLTITAASAPSGSGTVDCNISGRPATAREAYDRVWITGICNDNADQVYFGWGQTVTIMDSMYSLLWAKSTLRPESDNATAGTGAVASTGRLVATLYNPPVSGVNYLAKEIKKLNPVQDAYAQEGIGYDVLEPVQGVWEAFRNISYVGFVIVFVIIGFMIMFRAHISPQAVATVQDSLPRIVIALFLVTFSYAIAGLMIDVMFLVLNVALAALPVTDAADKVFTKSVFGVVWGSWGSVFGTVVGAMNQLINDTVDFGFIDKILGWFGGTLAGLVIGVALLFIMFKIFISLLIAYATIVILTIAAPFFFLMQALPGNNSASTWFKQMAANIAVFPAVAIMFVLAGYLGNISALGGNGEVFGTQEVAKFPLLAGDISANVLGQLVGIGLLLMTPGAADLVKNAIGAKSPGGGAAGAAAAGALSAGAAPVFAGPSAASGQAGKFAGDVAKTRFGATRIGQKFGGWAGKIDGGPNNTGSSK